MPKKSMQRSGSVVTIEAPKVSKNGKNININIMRTMAIAQRKIMGKNLSDHRES